MASGFLVLAGQTGDGLNDALASIRPGSITLVVMMGLAARDEIARRLVEHGWTSRTPSAIVCGVATPREWVWTGTLEELAAQTPPEGVAGVIVVGEVVSIREVLAAGRVRPSADEVKYGRR
jgi:siroheme synthase